jgi:hypothetical protein
MDAGLCPLFYCDALNIKIGGSAMKETFTVDKECKGSRRYASPPDSKFPIKSIYVDRDFANKKDKVELEIKEDK